MSGLDFLTEIMEQRPMPVIMLSSVAQVGSGVAQKAMERGAVHCFPKPLHSTPEEFDATVAKLGDIVRRAHSGELGEEEVENEIAAAAQAAAAPTSAAHADYVSDGSLVVIACGQAGLEPAMQMIAAYPAACPPTILLVDADREPVETAIASVGGSAACSVAEAQDGTVLAPGTVAVAFDRMNHVIVEAGSPPRLRCAARDPVGGIRPCADLLFGSIARAKLAATGGLLSGSGADGAKGLQILLQTGGKAFVGTPAEGTPRDRISAVQALGVAATELASDALADWVLEATAKG